MYHAGNLIARRGDEESPTCKRMFNVTYPAQPLPATNEYQASAFSGKCNSGHCSCHRGMVSARNQHKPLHHIPRLAQLSSLGIKQQRTAHQQENSKMPQYGQDVKRGSERRGQGGADRKIFRSRALLERRDEAVNPCRSDWILCNHKPTAVIRPEALREQKLARPYPCPCQA